MKTILFTLVLFFFFHSLAAQTGAGYRKDYVFLHSPNRVADKDFYVLTVIDQSPSIKNILMKDERLQQVCTQRLSILKSHSTDTCQWPSSLVEAFRYSANDSSALITILKDVYERHTAEFDKMINNHLRPSGYYQRFINYNNDELLYRAFGQYVTGINYIIDQFGLGKKMRYPRIDSASYNVNSRYYRTALKDMFAYLAEKTADMQLFYQPSLAIAMQLMELNDRDEPARHEPMEQKDNKKAFDKIKKTNWANYKYASIVIPGNGPELFTTPISPINKMHCDIAAERYKKGWAPFIIVSGGYCYPFQGPYCEAVEMKKYLIKKYAIDESAIIIDPHARHTTTNIRNANRLIIRYGIPVNKLSVFITTMSQTNMVASTATPNFDDRNRRELGYLPYRDKERIDMHCVAFYPTLESLHMDPYDPLDP